MDEQMRKERAEATHRARAAAWEAEKADAHASRVSTATHPALPGASSTYCLAQEWPRRFASPPCHLEEGAAWRRKALLPAHMTSLNLQCVPT